MSNFLSVASVTATLANIIQEGIVGHGMSATVSHVRPDGAGGTTPSTGVNVYLYQVTTNAAWRNVDLPTRNSSGRLIQRPKVALDLHYLLSFYGSEANLETQRLLGLVSSALHAQPVLAREKIRAVLKPADPEDSSYPYLLDTDLDSEVELVKFTQLPLSLEELSKLWSVFFQTQYTLSVAYQATVVLIDSDIAPIATLPVRETRFYTLPYDRIIVESILNYADVTAPIVSDDTILIKGSAFPGENVKVRIGNSLVTPTILTDRELTLDLADVPTDSLRPGVQGLQVIKQLPMGIAQTTGGSPLAHTALESNVAAFVLRPTIVGDPDVDTTDGATTFTVTVSPTVGASQRAVLYLNQTSAPGTAAYTLTATPRSEDGTTLEFVMNDLDLGTYLIRVQIDGAESLLTLDSDGKYDGPTVEIV